MQVWPKVAEFFGLAAAEPMHVPLAEVMRDKGPVWDGIVKKHNLQARPAMLPESTWQPSFQFFGLKCIPWACHLSCLAQPRHHDPLGQQVGQ